MSEYSQKLKNYLQTDNLLITNHFTEFRLVYKSQCLHVCYSLCEGMCIILIKIQILVKKSKGEVFSLLFLSYKHFCQLKEECDVQDNFVSLRKYVLFRSTDRGLRKILYYLSVLLTLGSK